jgi:hypothetical protein
MKKDVGKVVVFGDVVQVRLVLFSLKIIYINLL